MNIVARDLPDDALLGHYARREDCYTDCYALDFPRTVSLAAYVTAFYTTPLFKLERFILKWAVSRPSSDDQARQVAAGEVERFAAWSVEARTTDQLLMCDMAGRTRSWFKIEAAGSRKKRQDPLVLRFGGCCRKQGRWRRERTWICVFRAVGFSQTLFARAASFGRQAARRTQWRLDLCDRLRQPFSSL